MENIKEKNGVVETIALKKPMADGKTELALDFDCLTGYALIQCEKEAKKEDNMITVPNLSQVYLARVASVAANVRYDDICALPGNEFTKTINKVRNFLADMDS